MGTKETKCIDKFCPYKNNCKRFLERKEPDSIVYFLSPRSSDYCSKYELREDIIDVVFEVIQKENYGKLLEV